ncbi:cell division protein ZapA [Corticibacter populi]|uniref:Cell division protein ZapA n=1 Tax=Corticibacter populi TaxID=1550736 RepID=A0A3M6QY46_9BURK|nr:cell division protein ZapA [Corticibacter populi]RMX07940.1 cell division protein ZapA [Corticibacter populi]RZS35180.1 cell division protein ZapA [Corticibacter populi]
MNQVEVKILQQSYLLACKDGQEQRLLQAVRRVDEAMTRIHDAGKVRARERIAVLAALNLAFELDDLRDELADLQAQVQNPATGIAFAGDPTGTGTSANPQAPSPELQQTLEGLIAKIDHALQPDATNP